MRIVRVNVDVKRGMKFMMGWMPQIITMRRDFMCERDGICQLWKWTWKCFFSRRIPLPATSMFHTWWRYIYEGVIEILIEEFPLFDFVIYFQMQFFTWWKYSSGRMMNKIAEDRAREREKGRNSRRGRGAPRQEIPILFHFISFLSNIIHFVGTYIVGNIFSQFSTSMGIRYIHQCSPPILPGSHQKKGVDESLVVGISIWEDGLCVWCIEKAFTFFQFFFLLLLWLLRSSPHPWRRCGMGVESNMDMNFHNPESLLFIPYPHLFSNIESSKSLALVRWLKGWKVKNSSQTTWLLLSISVFPHPLDSIDIYWKGIFTIFASFLRDMNIYTRNDLRDEFRTLFRFLVISSPYAVLLKRDIERFEEVDIFSTKRFIHHSQWESLENLSHCNSVHSILLHLFQLLRSKWSISQAISRGEFELIICSVACNMSKCLQLKAKMLLIRFAIYMSQRHN